MKSILKISYLYLIILLFSSCEAEQNKRKSVVLSQDRDVLTYLKEVEWPKAYAEQDTVLLDRILGDDFQLIDQDGNYYSKKDELDWIKKNSTQNDSFYYEIKRLDILDNGTAIICGTGHIIKDSVNYIYQSSNVLVKRVGNWKAISSHVSGFTEID